VHSRRFFRYQPSRTGTVVTILFYCDYLSTEWEKESNERAHDVCRSNSGVILNPIWMSREQPVICTNIFRGCYMLTVFKFLMHASVAIFILSCCPDGAVAFQWPQFGGPQRDFTLDREPFNTPEFSVTQLWQIEIGVGKSELVIDNSSVYVCFRKDKPADESADNTKYWEGVAALDRQTGAQRWVYQYDCSDLEEQQSFSGDPRASQATPVIAGDWIFTLGFTGRLVCLNKSSGKVVWEKDLVADEQIMAEPVQFGFSASPVVVDGRLIIYAGGAKRGLMCLNLSDGSEVWSCDCGEATYATPVITTLCGKQQIVIVSAKEILSVDSQTGEILWRSDLLEPGLTNVPCPLPVGNDLLLISGQGAKGTYCLEITNSHDSWTARQVWKTVRPQFFYCNWIPIEKGNVALGCTETMMMAISTADGKLKGRWRGFGNGNLLRLNDQILCVNGEGDLSLISIGPGGLTQEFECGLINGRVWAAPTLVDDQLFLRTGKKVAGYRIMPNGELHNSLDAPETLEYRD
jgi:hypothetical protein